MRHARAVSVLGAVLFIAGLGSLTTCETPPMDTAQQRLGSNFLCYDTRYQSDQKYNPTAADYQALPTDACVNTAVAGYRTTDSKCKCRCSCDAKAAGYTGEGADCSGEWLPHTVYTPARIMRMRFGTHARA